MFERRGVSADGAPHTGEFIETDRRQCKGIGLVICKYGSSKYIRSSLQVNCGSQVFHTQIIRLYLFQGGPVRLFVPYKRRKKDLDPPVVPLKKDLPATKSLTLTSGTTCKAQAAMFREQNKKRLT